MSDEFQGTPPAPETPPPPPPAAPPAPPAAPSGAAGPSDTGKIIAGLGYLTGIVAIIGLVMEPYKDEAFVKEHCVQAVALYVLAVVASFASVILQIIPVVGQIVGLIIWLALIVVGVFALIAAIKAFTGQRYEIPVLYGFVKQYVK